MHKYSKLESYLIEFGLNDIEARMYLGLLELGTVTVSELISYLKLKRSTSYPYIQNLINNGLIIQIRKGSSRILSAEKPEKLRLLIEQKRWDIDRIESKIPDFIKELTQAIPFEKNLDLAEVTYYEGVIAVRSVYREVLKAKKVYSFVNVNQVFAVFPENPKLFHDALMENKDIEMWEIIEDSRISRDHVNRLGPKYHFKFIPENLSFSETDFIIFDDKVAMIHLSEQKPSAVLINSKSMSIGLKAIHKLVWDILPNP
jgi:sugar-specific transcriptional regulator TrmB